MHIQTSLEAGSKLTRLRQSVIVTTIRGTAKPF